MYIFDIAWYQQTYICMYLLYITYKIQPRLLDSGDIRLFTKKSVHFDLIERRG